MVSISMKTSLLAVLLASVVTLGITKSSFWDDFSKDVWYNIGYPRHDGHAEDSYNFWGHCNNITTKYCGQQIVNFQIGNGVVYPVDSCCPNIVKAGAMCNRVLSQKIVSFKQFKKPMADLIFKRGVEVYNHCSKIP